MSSRWGWCAVLALGVVLASSVAAQDASSILGGWDLMVGPEGEQSPSWFRVEWSGYGTLVGSFVGAGGSARPIAKVEFDEGHFRFTIPPQWEPVEGDITFEGTVEGDEVRGQMTSEGEAPVPWEGRRAPALDRPEEPRWGQATDLFNGQDLTGWKTRSRRSGWVARAGVLVNERPGGNIVTEAVFDDFRLHAEFRYPQGSNSGIYLRGRYEIQIEDDYGLEPDSHHLGGIYGFLTPCVNAARRADEWQTLDVTLVGRAVTIVLNGERIIDRQRIPGITGGALDSDESAPGPIMIQGDHGPIEFRKLTLTPAYYGANAPGQGVPEKDAASFGEGAGELPWNAQYVLGPDSQPRDDVPHGEVIQRHHRSEIVYPGVERDYWVYVPAQYEATAPACLMVFQDGGAYLAGDVNAPVVFDNLIAGGEMPVTIGLFVNPGNPGPGNPVYGGTDNRSLEYDALGDRYARYLIDELIREVAKDYALTDEAAGHAICGMSSGGICAFTSAWERPDYFGKVVSHCGSFADIRGGHVYPSLVRSTERKPIRVFLESGTHDADLIFGNWPLANEQMAAALKYRDYDYRFEMGEGGHSLKHGGALFPDTMCWLWRDYHGVVTP